MNAAGKKVGIDWDFEMLGIESDAAIARRLGVSFTTVHKARCRRGIPAAPFEEQRPNAVKWDEELELGLVPDTEIAERHGVHRNAVHAARKHRGIPCMWRDRANERERAKELRAKGWTLPDIAAVFDVSVATARRWTL